MTAESRSLCAAVAGGVDFLLGAQGDDGLWRDFRTPAGPATSWPSAYAGCALRLAGAQGSWLDRLSDALDRTQHPDGGWGYNEGTPTDADSTSWGLLALAGRDGVTDARIRALACLARHQRRGGGVATYAEAGPVRHYTGLSWAIPFWGWRRPHVEITAVAGRALHGSGSPSARDRAARAWRLVRSRQQDDGSWPSYWWTTPHVATEQAVRLAVLMAEPAPARRAAEWVQRHQGADGAWRDPAGDGASAFITALSVSILAGAGSGDPAALSRGVVALTRLQGPDGGWPATADLRIPVPPDRHPSLDIAWRPVRFGQGLVVRDQERVFTTATCLAALAVANTALRRPGPDLQAAAGS